MENTIGKPTTSVAHTLLRFGRPPIFHRPAKRFYVAAHFVLGLLILLLGPAAGAGDDETYDPLRIAPGHAPHAVDLAVNDPQCEREIPLRVYLPAQPPPAAVVLFSHGLGGSRKSSAYLGRHWAARGYVAVFLQHPGNEENVWKDAPRAERLAALRDPHFVHERSMHARLVAPILAGDEDTAEAEMRHHIRHSLENALAVLPQESPVGEVT